MIHVAFIRHTHTWTLNLKGPMIKFSQSSRNSLFTGEIIGSNSIESQNMSMKLRHQKVTKQGRMCRFLTRFPYRNFNYKAQKVAMVLSFLDIHGIIGSRTTLVIFSDRKCWLYSSVMECRIWCRLVVRVTDVEHFTHLQCCFQGLNFCGLWQLRISRTLIPMNHFVL